MAMKEVMKRGSRNTVSLWIFTEKVQYLRSYEEGRGDGVDKDIGGQRKWRGKGRDSCVDGDVGTALPLCLLHINVQPKENNVTRTRQGRKRQLTSTNCGGVTLVPIDSTM